MHYFYGALVSFMKPESLSPDSLQLNGKEWPLTLKEKSTVLERPIWL